MWASVSVQLAVRELNMLHLTMTVVGQYSKTQISSLQTQLAHWMHREAACGKFHEKQWLCLNSTATMYRSEECQ